MTHSRYVFLVILSLILKRIISTSNVKSSLKSEKISTPLFCSTGLDDHSVIRIPPEQIDDGYCDCPADGGIDEATTGACSGSSEGGWAGIQLQSSESKNELFESNHASIINGGVTILFVVPAHSYHYDHPEGTGKQQPPFNSIWFCGIPNDRLHIAKKAFENAHAKHNSKPMGDDHHHRSSDSSQNVTPPTPTLVSSVSELISMGILRAGVRPNPKRRKRGKNRLANTTTHAEAEFKSSNNTRKFTTMTQSQMERNSSSSSINNVNANTNDKDPKVYHPQGKNMKKSKHRNQNGVRTRKRF
mmetsp:Transcript_13305/g.19044  ORF Transcript_13305/g.19044 Transcript_13305/m.19044 type:complete len:301 (-) Transcript_13305:81-983(-)